MHTTNELTLPGERAAQRPWLQSHVLRFLADMRHGHLRLTLPDGETHVFGDPHAADRATITVRDAAFFRKCILYGDIGFGESYVDGDWDTDNIAAVIGWFLRNAERAPQVSGSRKKAAALNLFRFVNRSYHLLRGNTKSGSRRNITDHYDLGNEFFRTFLDGSMTYSSAYFSRPGMTLEEAQTEKYDRLCRALRLRPSDHVLEIGTGWGGFAIHAARTYGCRITTLTISAEQHALARARVAEAGLADRVDVQLCDYRDAAGVYDKIVSIEMLEAVGHRYFEAFFAQCERLLAPEGLLGLQVITCPDGRYASLRRGVDWIQKHIFPGTLLPSIARLNQAVNRTGEMSLFHLEDMGPHYAATLRQWRANFNREASRILDLGFDRAFLRKWNYYFSYCEAAFAARNISVVQMVYTRPNNGTL
jgi:cyclopropane-fatty-acyl-phospholipid synthase